MQYRAENADEYQLLSDIEMAEDDYNVNTKNTHRADKTRKDPKKENKDEKNSVSKKKLKFFKKYVKDVTMDIVECNTSNVTI